MASTIVEFMLFVGLTYTFGIWGGLFAITAIYGSKLAVSSWIAFRSGLISPRALFGKFDRQTLRDIGRFYPMLLAHSIAVPLAQILVRNGTVRTLGLEQGGYLQAVWRLSDMYVGVLTTALGFYFMAHFSSLESEGERGELLRRTILQLFVVTACCAAAIYVLRDVIIAVVLTASFAPLRTLLPFQLIGDVFKVVDYPLQMVLVTSTSGHKLHRAGHGRTGPVCGVEHVVAPLARCAGGTGGICDELFSRDRGPPIRAAANVSRQCRGLTALQELQTFNDFMVCESGQ